MKSLLGVNSWLGSAWWLQFYINLRLSSRPLLTPMLPINGPAVEVKCEDLEKIVVGDDLEKFFQART